MFNVRLYSPARAAVASTLLLFLNACGGGGDGGTQPTAAVASVAVSLSVASIAVPNTAQVTATTRDAGGITLTGRTVSWSSSSAAVATVSSTGLVTAVGPGSATITATREGKAGDAAITVTPPAVSSVSVALASPSMPAGSTTQATATTRDAQANVLTGRIVAWSSSSPGAQRLCVLVQAQQPSAVVVQGR